MPELHVVATLVSGRLKQRRERGANDANAFAASSFSPHGAMIARLPVAKDIP